MGKVIRDVLGAVINIGAWDFKIEPVMGDDLEKPIYDDDKDKPIYADYVADAPGDSPPKVVDYEKKLVGYHQKQVGQKIHNPMPEGAYECNADIVTSADGGIYATENHRGLRAGEYPSIGDQLDALYKAGMFPADMAARLKAVKDKYPKK